MRIMISAGGTGGGVYPAFAVAEALQAGDAGLASPELIFVGSVGGLEQGMVQQSAISWSAVEAVQGGAIRGVGLRKMIANTLRLAAGFAGAWNLIRRYRPNRVFLTGGWASLPVGLAAWLWRAPLLIFVPDIEPGWVLKLTGRLARKVAATTGDTARYFRAEKVVATGYPLRQSVLTATREAGQQHFGLDPAKRTVMVWGGSRGARSINRAVLAALPDLLSGSVQVIHVSGTLDWPEVQAARERLAESQRRDYHAFDFLHGDMGLALVAADLIVSRAGGSTLGEYPHFGLPAILVPYPYTWRYQKVNADYLAERGAALRLDDEALKDELYPAIRRLLDDPAALRQMAERAGALNRPGGAQNIARLLVGLEGE